jgi:hypothetical protein
MTAGGSRRSSSAQTSVGAADGETRGAERLRGDDSRIGAVATETMETPTGRCPGTRAGTTGDDRVVAVSGHRGGFDGHEALVRADGTAVAAAGPLRSRTSRPARADRGCDEGGADGRLVVFADALGFAALSLLVLQMVVSGRWPATTRSFGLGSVLSVHRQAGVAVLVLVVAHVVVLLVDDPARLSCWIRTPHPAARGPGRWRCSAS